MISAWMMSMAWALSWSDLQEDAWKELGARRSDVGTVRVRRQVVEGVTCLEGVIVTEVGADALLAVGRDMASADRWSSATLAVSEELHRGGGSYSVYQYFDVPNWTLASDRHWAIAIEVGRDGFAWDRRPLPAAHEGQAIEPPTNFGAWRFTPVLGGTEIRYRACADMGGSLPDAIERWVATSQVPATIADFVTEAKRR